MTERPGVGDAIPDIAMETADGGSVLGATAQLARDMKQSLLDFRQRLSE